MQPAMTKLIDRWGPLGTWKNFMSRHGRFDDLSPEIRFVLKLMTALVETEVASTLVYAWNLQLCYYT